MERFKIVAFTHKTADLKEIGKLHVEEQLAGERLQHLKSVMGLSELMYLSTCNRVEFCFVTDDAITSDYLTRFFSNFLTTGQDPSWAVNNALVLEGDDAIRHLFMVASSLDSLVVGEREIITQVRNAYEFCDKHKLDGVLLTLRSNFSWITCGRDNHIANNTPVGVATILATKDGKRVCLANSIEAPRMRN